MVPDCNFSFTLSSCLLCFLAGPRGAEASVGCSILLQSRTRVVGQGKGPPLLGPRRAVHLQGKGMGIVGCARAAVALKLQQ